MTLIHNVQLASYSVSTRAANVDEENYVFRFVLLFSFALRSITAKRTFCSFNFISNRDIFCRNLAKLSTTARKKPINPKIVTICCRVFCVRNGLSWCWTMWSTKPIESARRSRSTFYHTPDNLKS